MWCQLACALRMTPTACVASRDDLKARSPGKSAVTPSSRKQQRTILTQLCPVSARVTVEMTLSSWARELGSRRDVVGSGRSDMTQRRPCKSASFQTGMINWIGCFLQRNAAGLHSVSFFDAKQTVKASCCTANGEGRSDAAQALPRLSSSSDELAPSHSLLAQHSAQTGAMLSSSVGELGLPELYGTV
ncbi:uncharacterized protein HMPREF1120_01099 [Exophiala dermatitidis NIH/UT8656]|uniref:Uncharacterized protein n=1 Tax=Exophiala dermatitidis (strain ATCC 34100 / CBS 525.76 / NIH/UT8656) TaxID=858893 RepID=H6BLQ5_EXODN|nr:uncharacterized protein HMPREF1120_01099 [Exophiala dermatitidis NIH/UT8656]EHY52894.1 hypothetical protein HMPREF1120_01099 [Exophiala dermatitidis NIH/UT8656]